MFSILLEQFDLFTIGQSTPSVYWKLHRSRGSWLSTSGESLENQKFRSNTKNVRRGMFNLVWLTYPVLLMFPLDIRTLPSSLETIGKFENVDFRRLSNLSYRVRKTGTRGFTRPGERIWIWLQPKPFGRAYHVITFRMTQKVITSNGYFDMPSLT